MLVDRSEWSGVLEVERRPKEIVELNLVTTFNDNTMAAPFMAASRDGRRWWVKPLNNPMSPRVPVTELIVGLAGRLIQAPVCEVAVVKIPEEMAGEEYAHGATLEPGLASGSLHVPDVTEARRLHHRSRDDNRRRHAGVFALHDWCWGEDDQWLYAQGEDDRTYSHDHGSFLPGGPDWTIESLVDCVDRPHRQRRDSADLDTDALDGYADRLDRLTREDLRGMLQGIPDEWPVEQDELEAVGWFLERRAPQVAGRLRELSSEVSRRRYREV
jgi:hypothetical protein